MISRNAAIERNGTEMKPKMLKSGALHDTVRSHRAAR